MLTDAERKIAGVITHLRQQRARARGAMCPGEDWQSGLRGEEEGTVDDRRPLQSMERCHRLLTHETCALAIAAETLNGNHHGRIGYVQEGIGVPRILQWTGSRGGGPGQGSGDGSPPVGSRGKAPVGSLGDLEAEAKCEIIVQFLTFSCIKFWI